MIVNFDVFYVLNLLKLKLFESVALNPTPEMGWDSFVFSILNLFTTKNLYYGNTDKFKKKVVHNGWTRYCSGKGL
jgi:hypothetical protein